MDNNPMMDEGTPSRGIDPAVAGRRMAEVLELAEHLPRRPASRKMTFPPFP